MFDHAKFAELATQLAFLADDYAALRVPDKAPLTAVEAAGWANHGFTPGEAAPWIAYDHTPERASYWEEQFDQCGKKDCSPYGDRHAITPAEAARRDGR